MNKPLDLKLELFNFKKKLSLDQEEVYQVVEGHMNAIGNYSDKQVIESLNEKLKIYTYDKGVKSLLENLNDSLDTYKFLYELKHLYKIIESQNLGMIYRQPLKVLFDIINVEAADDRMSKVLNELAIYDYVPEIKLFVHNLTKSPEQKQNLLSGGRAEMVFTIVEQVEEGYVAYVRDSWFLLTDETIEKTLLETHIKDDAKLRTIRLLETAMKYATINDNRINFRISENLVVGMSVNKKGTMYINDDELNGETTLESLFSSPIVPIVNKNFYPLLVETSKNLDKFVELDVVKRVSNLINPYLEAFTFNYKNNVYMYRCDERYGNSFYKYESAFELVNEVRNELNFDLTYFYKNKVSKEVIVKRQLEDKEREITLKLEDVNSNIDKVKYTLSEMKEAPALTKALKALQTQQKSLGIELQAIKELQYKERIKA
jgi:hypothetical protein